MLTLLNTNQQKAFEKMLKEMETKHTPTEDVIHNWLCDQEDDELFKGILKDDRSIKGSVQYCSSKASEMKNENCAMVDDATVLGWVREYFISDKVNVKPVAAKVQTTNNKKSKKNVTKVQNKNVDETASQKVSAPDEDKELQKRVSEIANKRAGAEAPPAPPKIKKSEKVNEEIQINLFDSL